MRLIAETLSAADRKLAQEEGQDGEGEEGADKRELTGRERVKV